jgi:hypothetical protein
MSGASGIDSASSVEDVKAAFRRLGVELQVEPEGDGWQARVAAHGDEQLHESGAEPAEAALAAWREFVRRNGGTGES